MPIFLWKLRSLFESVTRGAMKKILVHIFGGYRQRGNTVTKGYYGWNTGIFIYGKNNTIEIAKGVEFWNFEVSINGNNNHIVIEKDVQLCGGRIEVKGDNNYFRLGENAKAFSIFVYAHWGRHIEIGRDCLFSENVAFKTSDSHSILNSDGERINPDKDVKIGDRVWLAGNVTVLKGVTIGDDVAVGGAAIVTKDLPNNCVAVGQPATPVKHGTTWDMALL